MLKPSVVKHRNYKNFTNDEFRRALLKELSLTNLQKGEFDRCKYLVARAKKVLLFPEISQLKRKNYVSGHFSRSDTLKQKAKSN